MQKAHTSAGPVLGLVLLWCGGVLPASAQTNTPATPAAPAARVEATPAEIEFWSTVKDSKSPAELRAYLTTYPNGAFAALARVRLQALETAAAPKPAPPAAAPAPAPAPSTAATTNNTPAAPGASALTSPEVIKEVQNKLYNLNYGITQQSGRLDNDTRSAIRQWQGILKRQETGDLSVQELGILRAAAVPSTWGAIGYNTAGGASSHWNVGSRARAEELALEGCRKLGGGNCQTITAANRTCLSISYSSGVIGNTRYNNAYGIARPTLAEAIDVAQTDCRSKARVPNNCGIRTTICADGSHKK